MTGRQKALMALVVAAWPLGGCADYLPDLRVGDLLSGLSSPDVPPPAGSPPPAARVATDPLSQFALASSQGTEGSLVNASGVAERARVLRAYTAASGRECREILLGNGGGERSQLVCGDAAGFQVARPLLRGSGVR